MFLNNFENMQKFPGEISVLSGLLIRTHVEQNPSLYIVTCQDEEKMSNIFTVLSFLN